MRAELDSHGRFNNTFLQYRTEPYRYRTEPRLFGGTEPNRFPSTRPSWRVRSGVVCGWVAGVEGLEGGSGRVESVPNRTAPNVRIPK